MTTQIPDSLEWNGYEFPVYSQPLYECGFWADEVAPEFESTMTCNWRGYVATWSIRDNRLYLSELHGTLAGGKSVDIGDLLPGRSGRRYAEQFTGEMRIDGSSRFWKVDGPSNRYDRGRIRLVFEQGRLRSMHMEPDSAGGAGCPAFVGYADEGSIPDEASWFSGTPRTVDAQFRFGEEPGEIALQVRQWQPSALSRFRHANLLEPFDVTLCFSGQRGDWGIPELLALLEKMTEGEEHGDLEWSAGPYRGNGGVVWRKREDDNSSVVMNLAWRDDEQTVEHVLRAEPDDLALTLYAAFRRFVESPLYDPLGYEPLHVDEVLCLIVDDPQDAGIQQAFIERTSAQARRLISAFEETARERKMERTLRTRPLEDYLQRAEALPEVPMPSLRRSRFDSILGTTPVYPFTEEWDALDEDRRASRLATWLHLSQWDGWKGARLKELRSKRLEEMAKERIPGALLLIRA